MAARKQSARSESKVTTPRSRRVKTLPSGPGTTIHYEGENLAVVVFNKKPGGGGIERPTITVCKCTKTRYECSRGESGNTICKEVCTEWDCQEIKAAL